nr:hypothetical protein [Candidatus Frankia alpina]
MTSPRTGWGSLDFSVEQGLLLERHGWDGALLGTSWGRPDTFTVATALAARTTTFVPSLRPHPRVPAHRPPALGRAAGRHRRADRPADGTAGQARPGTPAPGARASDHHVRPRHHRACLARRRGQGTPARRAARAALGGGPEAVGGAGTTWLVGTAAEVAAALQRYAELGITHFVLSDTPYKQEIVRQGEQLLPLLLRSASEAS